MSFASCPDNVEAGDAAVEPEAGDVGNISNGNVGIEIEQDANVAATGFVNEVV